MEKKTKYRLSGVAAGLTNGIFGGGGGIPLLVLLTKWAGVEEKKAFATCVAVIFPMCALLTSPSRSTASSGSTPRSKISLTSKEAACGRLPFFTFC